jgi:hypothetical protein
MSNFYRQDSYSNLESSSEEDAELVCIHIHNIALKKILGLEKEVEYYKYYSELLTKEIT